MQEKETDGVLHSRGPHARASDKGTKFRRDATTSCTLQAQMEGASERSILGQPTGSSEEGIDILPDAV